MKDITYYNKRCAEIMGMKPIKNNITKVPVEIRFDVQRTEIEQLKFNTSFDWQIPVWKKINAILVDLYYNPITNKTTERQMVDIMKIRTEYHFAINDNNADWGFKMISSAIDFIDAKQSNN